MRTSILGRRRRGEGQTEYVIITAMIMVCAVVSLFNFFGAAKEVALDKQLCIECEHKNQEVLEMLGPDGLPIEGEEGGATVPTDGAGDSETTPGNTTASAPWNNPTSPYVNTWWWPFFKLSSTVFGASYLPDIWSWFV